MRSFARKQKSQNENVVLKSGSDFLEKEVRDVVVDKQVRSTDIYGYPVSLVKKDLIRSLLLSGVVIAILVFLFFLQK